MHSNNLVASSYQAKYFKMLMLHYFLPQKVSGMQEHYKLCVSMQRNFVSQYAVAT
jgi:hypothetical protein